jgi:hypothetical protein
VQRGCAVASALPASADAVAAASSRRLVTSASIPATSRRDCEVGGSVRRQSLRGCAGSAAALLQATIRVQTGLQLRLLLAGGRRATLTSLDLRGRSCASWPRLLRAQLFSAGLIYRRSFLGETALRSAVLRVHSCRSLRLLRRDAARDLKTMRCQACLHLSSAASMRFRGRPVSCPWL